MKETEPPGRAGPARSQRAPGPLRRMLWSVPLGWQLSVLYTVLLAVTLGLVGTLVYTQQEDFLVQDTAMRLEAGAAGIAARPTFEFPGGYGGFPGGPGIGGAGGGRPGQDGRSPATDPFQLQEDLVRGLSGPDVTVAVRDAQGAVLTATQGLSGDTPPVVTPVTALQTAAVLAGGGPLQWIAPGANGSRQVVVLLRVDGRAPASGAVTSAGPLLVEQAASLAAADRALDRLRTYLLLGVLGGTLAGLALGITFTRAVLRPLDRVAHTAEAIAEGDLQRRLLLPGGRNEVARLGHAFDFMVGRLVAALEAQRRFVADASHELRTPLTSLKGLTEILMIGAHGNDGRVIEQSAKAIHEELDRMIRLVNDLLTLSRFDSTEGAAIPPTRPTRMDACVTLHAAAEQMGALAEGHDVRLVADCAGPLWVLGDPGQLKQVVLNLLDNALRHTPAGGEVAVRGAVDGATVRIAVQDTGAGIAARDLPHIFERFYRGDTSRSRATGNSGLGLAIVRALVEAQGGRIDVQSNPGAGTCFTIRLPLAAAGPAPRG